MIEFTGKFHRAQGKRFGIVASRFNETIVKNLVEGALDALRRHGVNDENITLAWVTGAFEIPVVAKKLACSGDFDGIICLGTVIRGSTPHFDYVAGQASSGISHAALESGIPVLFGVLTTDTIEQAIERSGTKAGNKGAECAMGAIEMVDLMQQLGSEMPVAAKKRPQPVRA